MDDYTWQAMIQRRKARRRQMLIAIPLLFACALGALIWYFGIWRRSPDFAVEAAVAAAKNHDEAAFQKYVNLDRITGDAYDDLTVDLFAYDSTLTESSKVLFEKFYVLIKPQMVDGTKDVILGYLKTGEWTLPDGTDILKGRQLGIDYERFIERSQLCNTDIEKVGEVRRTSETTAVVPLDIRETYTGTAFRLELQLEKGKEGWQIVKIRNYRAYLDDVAPIFNRDIESYINATKDIVAKYNGTLDACRERFTASTTTADGSMTDGQRAAIANMLEDEVIPALKKRQRELDEVKVPPGAAYLAKQRKDSTETTIASWQHYIRAMRTGDASEYAKAEALHKQELAIDLRIEDIIHHTAVSKNIPNLP